MISQVRMQKIKTVSFLAALYHQFTYGTLNSDSDVNYVSQIQLSDISFQNKAKNFSKNSKWWLALLVGVGDGDGDAHSQIWFCNWQYHLEYMCLRTAGQIPNFERKKWRQFFGLDYHVISRQWQTFSRWTFHNIKGLLVWRTLQKFKTRSFLVAV